MLITQRNTLLKKVAFVLGVWILTQLGPGYLSTAAASECPINTSCVTRYDDEVASDGLNGLNLRQAVGETATSAVFIGATTAVTISLNTPLEIRKDISISAQVNSEGQNLVTIRPSESFDVTPESRSLIQIFAESATANVTISNVIVNGTSQDSETAVRAVEVIENSIETSTVPLLKIESSTIQNSGVNSDGGAVLTPGDITVSNSTFTNNSAVAQYGGAIYAGGEIRVEKSTFTGNTAGNGGVIASHSSETITITNSVFQSNTALGFNPFEDAVFGDGGAIFAVSEDDELPTVSIDTSEFLGNEAAEYGGAVYVGGEIRVERSTFTGNTAGDSGGAIASHSSETITITNSVFQSNVATGISGDFYAGGGAIKGGDGLLQVDGSTFSENVSNLDGGAILHFGDIEVTDSVFKENEARFIDYGGESIWDGSGGAIFAVSEDNIELVSVSINSSSFLENTAAGNGGAITVLGQIEVSESSFSYNSAAGRGGAIDIEDSQDISGEETTSRISSSDFISNDATEGDGGAIDGSGYVLVVEESNFVDNYAGYDGGAIWSGGLVRVLHSDFSGNTADEDGGAIDADSVQINQSQFLDNEALYDGGAIHVQNDESENILSAILNTKFDANKSISGQGNALYGNAWLLLNSFVNYRTRDNVSAIALETNFGSVSIGNSFAEQNPEVDGDDFCDLGFDYSANNFASDSSCLGNFEADPVKSKVASSSVDSDGYLAFSDDIFNGETGLLAFDSNSDLRDAFIDTARRLLDDSPLGPLPTGDEIEIYESITERREAEALGCWFPGIEHIDYFVCVDNVYAKYQVERALYLETFGEVTELNLILEDVNDLDGHQFIQQYLSVDQNYFDRAVFSTWTAGAVHLELKPVVVSNSNTPISIRSVSSNESDIFSSLEEQKIRAEKAALAEAKKEAARSLRLAEVEKRRALIAQMRTKMAATQVRGEMLKLKKQWQNLMKNFIW